MNQKHPRMPIADASDGDLSDAFHDLIASAAQSTDPMTLVAIADATWERIAERSEAQGDDGILEAITGQRFDTSPNDGRRA